MAAKKPQSPAMEFLLASLEKNPKATYAEIKAAADEKKLAVYPIMFGRAQAMLGIVKSAKRGQGKAAKAKSGGAAPATHGKPAAKRGRPAAGSGTSKSDQIRELLKTGMAPADIAKKVGCSTNLVYVVKSTDGTGTRAPGRPRGEETKRGPGRPPKAAAVAGNGLDSVISAVRQSEQEHAKLVAAIQRIRGILAEIA